MTKVCTISFKNDFKQAWKSFSELWTRNIIKLLKYLKKGMIVLSVLGGEMLMYEKGRLYVFIKIGLLNGKKA